MAGANQRIDAGCLLCDDVVIATRNRPDDMQRLLASVSQQSRLPQGVLIIDSSDGDDTETIVARWANDMSGEIDVRRIVAPPGSSSQRNVGIHRSYADIVHFLDDDVTLDRDYFHVIMRRFEADRELVGVGGVVGSEEARRPRVWWRLALLDSLRPGCVLPSGMNVPALAVERPVCVDWLSGCAMSYRREIAERVRFDEALSGYALMEDVDFGYRASRLGRLLVDPSARCIHHLSGVNRWSDERRHRMAVVRRGWFVNKNLPKGSRVGFWWSTVAGFWLFLLRGAITARRSDFARARWQLLGAWDYLKGER